MAQQCDLFGVNEDDDNDVDDAGDGDGGEDNAGDGDDCEDVEDDAGDSLAQQCDLSGFCSPATELRNTCRAVFNLYLILNLVLGCFALKFNILDIFKIWGNCFNRKRISW